MPPQTIPEWTTNDPLQDLRKRYAAQIPKSFEYSGYTWAGTVNSVEKIKALKDMQFGPNDVVIVSCPKSGTTWTSEVLSAIAYEGNTDLLKSARMMDRVPWIELDPHALTTFIPQLLSYKIQHVAGAKMRVFTAHLPLEFLPRSILDGKCKLLYVARNPKDHAVSYFHFHKTAKFLGLQTDLTWDEFFSLFCSGSLWYGNWFDHVLSYWKFTRNTPNAKFICYEEMKADLMGEIESIEKFVGISLSKDQRKEVVDHCSFASMKTNAMTNRENNFMLDDSTSKFLRKGIVGDWKNYFTVAQSKQFDELFKRRMAGSGLDFEFE